MARSARNATVLHMVIAMAVILVPVLAVMSFFTRVPEPAISVVDHRPVAAQARAAASYPLLVPANLPADWVCTRARWTPPGAPGVDGTPVPGGTWQLGFLTAGRVYLGLDQRDVAPEPFIAERTRQGRPEGESRVGAATWQRMVSADGRTRSLVLRGASAVVVSGDVPYDLLEAFAGTLEPAS